MKHGLIHGDFNEFNLMVDEDQKVWTIDFPQMVSSSHPDAEYYFERDQTCIHTLFKRKFSYISDRSYKLAEFEILHHLDKEMKVSGAAKQSADDLAFDEYLAAIKDRDPEQEGQQIEDEMESNEEGNDNEGDGEEEEDIERQEDAEEKDTNEELGNIEEEMKAMNIQSEDIKKEETPQPQEEEAEPEEVDWEAQLEKRKQMKALKKERLAAKKPKLVSAPATLSEPKKEEAKSPEDLAKADTKDKKSDESESDEDSEKETELIRKALKKKYRKKKVHKVNKNHPKQFNEAVRDQMDF